MPEEVENVRKKSCRSVLKNETWENQQHGVVWRLKTMLGVRSRGVRGKIQYVFASLLTLWVLLRLKGKCMSQLVCASKYAMINGKM